MGSGTEPGTLTDYLAWVPPESMVLVPTADNWALAVARLPAPLAARSAASSRLA